MYVCFRCGRRADSEFLPDGWSIRYDGIVLCPDCADALKGDDKAVEFLKDISEAMLATKSALNKIKDLNLYDHVERDIMSNSNAQS